MGLVLDAGALIAYERREPVLLAALAEAVRDDAGVATTSAVVGQVWRGGPRSARLALLLQGIDEVELTRTAARRVGVLLANADASDVVDATVVDAAVDGDEILTSDPDDLRALALASGKSLVVTPI